MIFYSWTNSFGGSFDSNSSDANDTQYKTIAISCHNSYFSLHDLDTSIIEEAPIFKEASIFKQALNCHNNLLSESLDSKSWYDKKNRFSSFSYSHLTILPYWSSNLKENRFAKLSDLDLQEFLSNKLQDKLFAELSDLDL